MTLEISIISAYDFAFYLFFPFFRHSAVDAISARLDAREFANSANEIAAVEDQIRRDVVTSYCWI